MPDDLDDKIRAAMKVLDEETPSGYFEAVPNQILARLEDGSMQHGSGTTDFRKNADALMGPPVVPEDADTNPTPRVEASEVGPLPSKPAVAKPAAVVAAAPVAKPAAAPAPTETATPATPASSASMSAAADRDEDSGLHDIRNLAQSTKQRLSARRITQQPPTNDDVLASSSGSFAGIALPQPARMVSLPEIEDLPSKQEVIAAQKAAAKARKEKKPTVEPTLASKDVLAPQAAANLAVASMTVAPAAAAVDAAVEAPVRQAFSLPSQQNKKSKAPLFAILGLGAAAAAGAFIFMGDKSAKKSETVAAASSGTAKQEVAKEPEKAAAAAPTAEPIAAAGSAAEPAPVEEAKPAEAAAVAAVEDDGKDEDKARKRAAAPKGAAKKDTEEKKTETKTEEPKVEAKEIKTPDGTKKVTGDGNEPSFDALLKEAGVEDKKVEKPKLEKKSLSGDDFKKGMAAIQSKAQGCYKGTQGTASVKLTVGPDGKVTKATVGGQFAGTPEGGCVEAAVKGATFPAWDGGPQSFNYSYMLSD